MREAGLVFMSCCAVVGAQDSCAASERGCLPQAIHNASNASENNVSLDPHDYETFYDHVYDHAGYHNDQQLSHEPPYVARYVELAKREPNKLRTVIVLGCSHGLGAMLLHKDGLQVWGIDIAE